MVTAGFMTRTIQRRGKCWCNKVDTTRGGYSTERGATIVGQLTVKRLTGITGRHLLQCYTLSSGSSPIKLWALVPRAL